MSKDLETRRILFKKKEFIVDKLENKPKKRIRNCDYNLAKMNYVEILLFMMFYARYFRQVRNHVFELFMDFCMGIWSLLVGIFWLLNFVFPIGLFITAGIRFHRSRFNVEKEKNRK